MNDLDSIIAAMYESVCYEKGGHPDWETDEKIFAPGARMVRINDGGVFEFDMKTYRTDFERMISSGSCSAASSAMRRSAAARSASMRAAFVFRSIAPSRAFLSAGEAALARR